LQSGYRIPIKEINNRDMISQKIFTNKIINIKKLLNSKYVKNMGLKTMKCWQRILHRKSGMIVDFIGGQNAPYLPNNFYL
jgi:hypothetical protein